MLHNIYALCILALTVTIISWELDSNVRALTAGFKFIYSCHLRGLAEADFLQCPKPAGVRKEREIDGLVG
jgi:hypothetical protein